MASASTSKWVSAAVILWLVDAGILGLDDRPQDHLSATQWPLPSPSGALTDITLRQLLSFTSGLNNDVLCSNAGAIEFFACVGNIARNHAATLATPGSEFSYGSNHLQVAGAMAVAAGGYSSWEALFADFTRQTGLFPTSTYDLPSTGNPRLAGGMTWTGEEYVDFVRAYRDGGFLSDALIEQASRDRIGAATLVSSPAMAGIGRDWHYGFGQWIECDAATFDPACDDMPTVSSPGAYGAYPFLDRKTGAFGIIARQGALGTFPEGYTLFEGMRERVDAWVACQP